MDVLNLRGCLFLRLLPRIATSDPLSISVIGMRDVISLSDEAGFRSLDTLRAVRHPGLYSPRLRWSRELEVGSGVMLHYFSDTFPFCVRCFVLAVGTPP